MSFRPKKFLSTKKTGDLVIVLQADKRDRNCDGDIVSSQEVESIRHTIRTFPDEYIYIYMYTHQQTEIQRIVASTRQKKEAIHF